MGDRARTKWAEKWGAVPLSVLGAGSLSNTVSPGPPYQVVSWCIQPFGHRRHGLKSGGCWRLGRGLHLYQAASWSVQPFGHNTPTLQDTET